MTQLLLSEETHGRVRVRVRVTRDATAVVKWGTRAMPGLGSHVRTRVVARDATAVHPLKIATILLEFNLYNFNLLLFHVNNTLFIN